MTDTPGTLEERLRGGKCPQCQGWGEVAYFGEIVGCTCLGRYKAPISMATRTEAADEIASLRARVEAVETVAEEALDQLWHLAKDPNTNPLVLDLTAVLRTRKELARQSLKDTPDAE